MQDSKMQNQNAMVETAWSSKPTNRIPAFHIRM